jgi:hypothetical protein
VGKADTKTIEPFADGTAGLAYGLVETGWDSMYTPSTEGELSYALSVAQYSAMS